MVKPNIFKKNTMKVTNTEKIMCDREFVVTLKSINCSMDDS